MSADNRTVATDALATIGQIITIKEKRDAIHLAVENVIAGERLRPGQHVRYSDGYVYSCSMPASAHGIVDPFLVEPVLNGQRCWLFILPRKIGTLRHVWTHADFPDEPTAPDFETEMYDDCKGCYE